MSPKLLFCLVIGFSLTFKVSAQDEAYICRYLFASSDEITQLSTDAISLAVDAVWEASGITGVVTTTGTLTQNPNNPDEWTYSPTPNDKLVLNFATGVSVVFTFYSITGYTGGTAEDFKWSHQMDFNTFVQNQMNMRVNSNTYPQGGKIYWQRTITGSAVFDSQTMNLNITHNGNIEYDIGSGYAFYKYTEQASGTSSTGTFSVNISESYWRHIGFNSNPPNNYIITNTEITNNSTGNFGGTTYKYQNGYVFWVTKIDKDIGPNGFVFDSHQWVAQGTMLKNGQHYGTVQFDGPVTNYSSGPNLILHLNNGTNIFIHTLINSPTSVNEQNNVGSPDDFIILQNYPNPFNASTTIQYILTGRKLITIKIFDALGREIETIVNNEDQPAGNYNLIWNAENLTSGIYFCRIQVASEVQENKFKIIKLILLK